MDHRIINSQFNQRDRVFTLIYNLAVWGRRQGRRLTRSIEMGVRVLVVRGDEVLLVRHRGGKKPWSLPGGGIRHYETLTVASQREVFEETGCPVLVEQLHGIFHSFGKGFSNHIVVFVCTPLGDMNPPVGDLEIAAAAFFPLTELPVGIEDGSRRRVAEYLRGEYGITAVW